MHIELPNDPVDGYELCWYDTNADCTLVRSYRAVFHINTPFKEACPSLVRYHSIGLPFVQSWAVVSDRNLMSRDAGWSAPMHFNHDRMYATREEAVAVCEKYIRNRIANLQREIAEFNTALEKLLRP